LLADPVRSDRLLPYCATPIGSQRITKPIPAAFRRRFEFTIMKPATKSIVSGMALVLCAVVVGVQAWSVGNCWSDMFTGHAYPITPSWFVERGLITAFAFYASVAVIRVLHHQGFWNSFFLCIIALGLCLSGAIHRTSWGLPTFVGIHLAALVCVIVRYIGSLFDHSPTQARSVRNA
jgi:hypothetical protein